MDISFEDRIEKLEKSQELLLDHFVQVLQQFSQLRQLISQQNVKQWAVDAVDSRRTEISKLTDDCVKALNLLCELGLVDRKTLNEIVAGCQVTT